MHEFLGQIVLPSLFLLFLAATLFQLACWLGVFGRFGRFLPVAPPRAGGRKNSPAFAREVPFPVSVVVCARDEAANLRRHLPLWLAQVYAGDWELLVVDDASEDDTPAVLQFFQEKYPRLRVVRLAEKITLGKKAALAQGIAAAQYEHLVLTDADCAPVGPHWLAHMAGDLTEKSETEIVLGYAPLSAGAGLLNRWARFETAYTALQYFAFARIGMPYMGVGRNLAWKRPLFQQAGGFVRHADLPSGDDDLLVNAVARPGRVALCLLPDAFVYSAAKTTWAGWLRQKQRQLGSGLRYRWWHQLVLGAVAASQTLHYFFALLLFVVIGLRPTLGISGFPPLFVSGTAGLLAGWVLGLWLLRLILVMLVWQRILWGFRERSLLIWVPLLDILLALYYAGFVPLAFLRGGKKAGWK